MKENLKWNDRLREIRKEKGLTLKTASEGLHLPLTTYANYEHGIRQPSFDLFIQICNFFDVSADYLLGLSDE